MALEDVAAVGSVADAGGGDGGGAAVADAPATEVEETPIPGTDDGGDGSGGGAPADGADAAASEDDRLPGDEAATDDDPDAGDIEMDGRKMDARTRAAIEKLKAVDPEAAKAVREAYFSRQSVLKEFPEAKDLSQAIRSIRTMKATLEAVGGHEGIENLQTEVTDYRNEINAFSKGDRALIEQLYEGNPESTATAALNCLDVLQEKNYALFEKTMLPSVAGILERAEMSKFLQEAAKHCTDGNGQGAYDTITKIAAWVAKLDKSAKGISEARTKVDPERQKIDEERQQLNREKTEMYERGISHSVTKFNNDAIAKITAPLFKQLGLNGEGRRDFTQNLMNRVWSAMKADKSFQRLAKATMAKGDGDKAARLIADKFEELLPEHYRKYRDLRYPNMPNKGAARPAGKPNGAAPAAGGGKPAATPGGSAAMLVTKLPSPETVDWTKTTDEMYHVGRGMGEAILTNGKRVKWDWTKV